jgi:hypothetical protein
VKLHRAVQHNSLLCQSSYFLIIPLSLFHLPFLFHNFTKNWIARVQITSYAYAVYRKQFSLLLFNFLSLLLFHYKSFVTWAQQQQHNNDVDDDDDVGYKNNY